MCINKHSIWKYLVIVGVLSATILVSSFIAHAEEETEYDPVLNPQLIQAGFLTKSINISNSGTASFSVPIEVPPGRGGIAVPNLSLQYCSSGSNGWTGVGWDLDVGSIQRNTKYGLDYSGNDFVVNGSTELVSRTDWGSDYFGAKIEEAFTKYQFISPESGWIATHKDGTRYYYGSRTDSRQENANGVFKWCLDKIEDVNGNTMSVEYVKDQGRIYPSRINYTDDLNYVAFTLEDRPDITTSYNTHSEVKTAKRLAGISVYGNDQLTRHYVMEYEIGTSSARSRLNRINVDPLPPIIIAYQEGGDGSYDIANYNAKIDTLGYSNPNITFFVDVNGDSRADMIKRNPSNIYAYLGQDDGSFSEVITTDGLYSCVASGCMQTGDVNGDGLVDLIAANSLSHQYNTFLSMGDGTFGYAGTSMTDSGYGVRRLMLTDLNRDGKADLIKFANRAVYVHLAKADDSGLFEETGIRSDFRIFDYNWVDLGDINGDGLPDLIRILHGLACGVDVHLANEDGTFAYEGIRTDMTGVMPQLFRRVLDVNADGLTDVITYSYTDDYSNVHVHLSKGDGTFDEPKQSSASRRSIVHAAIFYPDVNGDGYPDFIYRDYHENRLDGGYLDVYFGRGDGTFTENATTTEWPLGYPGMSTLFFADINGDSLDDFISQSYLDFYSYLAVGSPPDLLTSKTDSYGAVTTVEYTPSSNYLNYGLPYVVQTVSSIEVNDGLGALSTTIYNYNQGYYDVEEREYRGFHEVSQTNPDSTRTINYYHVLDNVKKGKKYRAESKDPSNNLMIFSFYDWDAHSFGETGGNADFVKLIGQDAVYYDSPTEYVGWHADLVYDNDNGNLLSKTYSGAFAENVTLSYDYDNYGDWNWRRTQQTLEGSTTGKVRETTYEYYTGTGNLMWKEPWLSDGSHPTRVTYTYDSYGNLETATDAMGNTTTTEYESVLHTHPARIISPATGGTSHIVEYPAYDYLWGKPTQMIDENGNITSYAYDGIGRLVQTDLPDGSRETRSYYDSAIPWYVFTQILENASDTINTYEYFDGLSRPVQTISFGENNTLIVTRQHYDNMGRNYLNQGPFFYGGSPGYPRNPSGNYPYEHTTHYDYRGRPLRIVTPLDPNVHSPSANLAEITFSYSLFDVTVTDPDEGQKTERKDYLGRIHQVIEHAGTEDYNTLYQYNAAGDLLRVQNHLLSSNFFTYDTLGRKRSMEDLDLGNWSYTYDANGNLKTQTDAKSQVITFANDELNRVTSKTYSTSDPSVTFTYDNPAPGTNGIGRPHTISNSVTTTTYDAYDEMGRELSVTKSIQGAPSSGYTTVTTYDLAGKVAGTTYPDYFRVDYAYHPGTGLLNTITGSPPDSVQYALLESYEPTGKIGHISYGNGTATDYSYDSLSTRLTSIITAGAAEILNKAYTYTPAGDIASLTDTQSGVTYSYTYDRLHRLVSETNDGPSDNFSQATLVSTYDDQYRPLHAPASIRYNLSEHNYTYDANGNLTVAPDLSDPYYNSSPRSASNSIIYNADNMPVRISNRKDDGTMVSTIAVDFTYDGNGTREKKALSNGDATYYIGNHFEVANGVETKYIFAGNQRIAKVTTGNSYFFHKDHLGSSSVMTDYPNGATVETTEYLPFGHERDHTGADVTNYKFTDQEKDTETGLYNYDARMYDPVIALFISADSVDQDWYDPQKLNRYAYCRNNPLKYIDPDGHVVETAWDAFNIGLGVQSFGSNIRSGNYGAAAVDAVGTIIDTAAAAIPLIPGGAGMAIKAVRTADKAIDAANVARKSDKILDASKKTAAKMRAENIKKGIPENQLGPSGKPKIHVQKHSSLKKAKDAARERAGKGGTTVKHPTPKKGKRHFHGQKQDGTKIRTHDEYSD